MEPVEKQKKASRRPKCTPQQEQEVVSYLQRVKNGEHFRNEDIATRCNVSQERVCLIRKRFQGGLEEETPWYQRHFSMKDPNSILRDVIQNREYDIMPTSTDLYSMEVPVVSEEILQNHTMSVNLNTSDPDILRNQKRCALERANNGKNYHGFTIFPKNVVDCVSTEEKASADEDFSKLLSSGKLDAQFTPIFQHVQKVLSTDRQKPRKRGTVTVLDRRMGDLGRWHVQFSQLLADARKQANAAETALESVQRKLKEAEEHFNCHENSRCSTRLEDSAPAHKKRRKQDLETLTKECESEKIRYQETKETLNVIEKTIELICHRFKTIRKVLADIAVLAPFSNTNLICGRFHRTQTSRKGFPMQIFSAPYLRNQRPHLKAFILTRRKKECL